MQAKHIVSKSSPVWQHINDRSGILSVKNSIGICYNRIKIKWAEWKQMEAGVGGAVKYLKSIIDSLSLKTLLCFIKLIKNLVPCNVGNFSVEMHMHENIVVWKTWGQTGAVDMQYFKWTFDGFLLFFASTHISSTRHVLSSSTLRYPRVILDVQQALNKIATLLLPTKLLLI